MPRGWPDGPIPAKCLSLAAEVAGDFAEFGIYRSHSFQFVVRAAMEAGRTAHGFDSFVGMDEPGEHDKPIHGRHYPKGKFSSGTSKASRRLRQQELSNWVFHEGFIPDCFEPDLKFAFAYVDVDHYLPTVLAAAYADERLPVGGVLGFDDYIPGGTTLATRAIGEFRRDHGHRFEVLIERPKQVWFIKKT